MVNTTVTQIAPIGGTTNEGTKLGAINSYTGWSNTATTITITNASTVDWVELSLDTNAERLRFTTSTNVLSNIGASGTAAISGLVVYR